MNIAVLGYMASGKSELSKRFEEKHGYKRFSFATELKKIAVELLGREIDKGKDREMLQKLSKLFKTKNIHLTKKEKEQIRNIVEIPYFKEYKEKHKLIFGKPHFFANILCNNEEFIEYANKGKAFIDDMRFKIEPETLKYFGFDFKKVRLEVPQEICERRLLLRDGYFEKAWFEDESEQEWKQIKPDITINHAYTKKIDLIVKEIFEKLGV